MKKRRLIRVVYDMQVCTTFPIMEKIVGRLHTLLDMACMPHVIIKNYEFVGGAPYYEVFIDRGKWSWWHVKRDLEAVWHTKIRYTNEYCIEDGVLKKYTD